MNAAAPRAIPKGWSTAQHDAKVAQEAVNARAAGKQTAAGTQADAGAADAQPSAAGEPGVGKEERLKDVAVLQGLVANLSAGDFATRETATRELMKAGREAFPLLRDAESTGDKETQSRARKILDEIEWPVTAAAIKKIKSLGGTVIGVDPKRPGGVSIQNCTDQPRLHIRDADVACIEDLHYLHVATFVRVDLADETCAHLAKLPNLKMIRLDDTDVSDVGVRRLLPLRRLAQLDLGKTKVTGTGFQDLTSISTLSEVELVDAAVTDE
ncbi:MAG TPA: hypothetical protein VFE24_10060, partial [Pirellulales bacterium]|nr:hypothetical protein [Pirellulales bacterium]